MGEDAPALPKSARNVSAYSAYPEEEFVFLPGNPMKVEGLRGDFVQSWSENQALSPDLPEWKRFVRHYQRYFQGVSAADVEAQFKKGFVPNLIVDLRED